MDLKLIDGVPHWSARGADSFSPFSSGIFTEVIGFTGIDAFSTNGILLNLKNGNIEKGMQLNGDLATLNAPGDSIYYVTANKNCSGYIYKTNDGTWSNVSYKAGDSILAHHISHVTVLVFLKETFH